MPGGQHLLYVSSKELLNALPACAALLAPNGEIKAVNKCWIDFAEQNGLRLRDYGVRANYLHICEAAQGPDRKIGLEVARGLRELARGLRASVWLQYPCHSPTERRWYLLHATRVGPHLPSPVLTLHENITPLVLNQERLETANSELSELAMFISHDVRVPLHTIASYLDLIRQNLDHRMEQSTCEYFDIARTTASRVSQLVTETLNLAILNNEQRELSMQQLDMNLIVRDAIQNAAYLIREFDANVSVDHLGMAYGNYAFLVRLFQNLVSNAVLYSGHKACVHVGVEWRDGQQLFFVRDSGPGIPADAQDTIFLPFNRLNSSERKGTGLGLTICRQIVERHRGRIFVVSKSGQGSTFYFSLQASA